MHSPKPSPRRAMPFDCAVLDLVRVCCVCKREPVRRQPASLSRGRAPWDTEWYGATGIAPRTVPERGTPGASLQPSFTSWLSYRRAFSFLGSGTVIRPSGSVTRVCASGTAWAMPARPSPGSQVASVTLREARPSRDRSIGHALVSDCGRRSRVRGLGVASARDTGRCSRRPDGWCGETEDPGLVGEPSRG